MKIVFMGTSEFSVTVLDRLYNSQYSIVGVVSQPNREKDKKGRLLDTPVKKYSDEHNLPIFQFDKVSANIDALKTLNADVFVTAAYGQLLSQQVIDLPKFGIVNVHASILPRYRGSSPIQAAILNGDEETGVTIMKTELSMDTGAIYGVDKMPIGATTTAGELEKDLSERGAKLLLDVLNNLDTIPPIKQDDSLATYTKKIKKTDAIIDWNKPATLLLREINAYNPSPISFFAHNDRNIKVYSAEVVESASAYKPGQVLSCDSKNGLIIKCKKNALKILKMQAPGKNVLLASDFLKGYKFELDELLGGVNNEINEN